MGGSDGGNANGGFELTEGAIVSMVRAEVRKQLSGLTREHWPHVAKDTFARLPRQHLRSVGCRLR